MGEAAGVLRISDTMNCSPPVQMWEFSLAPFRCTGATGRQRVPMTRYLGASWPTSTSMIWLPSRARPPACRGRFHNAYSNDKVSGTSLTGLVRTGKHFGPETWGAGRRQEIGTPDERPKQLVHGRRAEARPLSVASPPPKTLPQKIKKQTELPPIWSMCTYRRKRPRLKGSRLV